MPITPGATELCFLSISEAGERLRSGRLSPVALTQAFLDRIEALDSTLHAYITVLGESAMDEARLAEAEISRGDYRGPLHGIPIALKDLYDTSGVRTTAGSKVMAERVPTEDATATARLKGTGAILLGKLALHEYALGAPDPTNGFPMARNPWSLDHIPGGSSSGSATAVAAGLCMGTLGSCTGGSIRGPASYSGIVGLKATYGRVSRHGVVPLSWSLDHCGPMTWTVEDTAIMLQAIAGRDPKDPTTSAAPVPDYSASLGEGIEGLKVGVPRHYFFADDPSISRDTLAVVEGALNTLAEMGARIEEVTVPSLRYAVAAQNTIMLSEAFAYHRGHLLARPQDYGEIVRARFRIGALLSGADYVQAQRVRKVLKREFAEALERVDLIASPTMSTPAPTFEESASLGMVKTPSFTGPYNLTGMPAISVPCGFTPTGLPVGLQLAGKPFDEPTVLRAAHAYQQHTRLFERRPPL